MQFSLLTAIFFTLVYPIPLEYLSTFMSPYFETFLFTFGKLFWAIAISVIIFTCHHGYAGFINRFLSMNVWIPLSKMSLSFYLTSAGIQYIYVLSQRQPQNIESVFDVVSFFMRVLQLKFYEIF